jgi:LSD1 subclass zinc finger protein
MNEFNEKNTETEQTKCHECGAILHFEPGTTSLKCQYCGAENEIEISDEVIEELDFNDFINNKIKKEEKIEVTTVKCNGCGASVTMKPNITSDECPFCGTPLVVDSGTTNSIIKPKSLLSFKIDKNTAFESYKKWVKKLWFAPSKLKQIALNIEKMRGMYIPFWTYDSNTYSQYRGRRGVHYYVTESYTSNGQTKTRQVRKTRWTSVSGTVRHAFDDILILATKSLPKKKADKLEPWDLEELVPYDNKFLSGFQAESYQVELNEGFVEAKGRMDDYIRKLVKQDIGGDEQRVTSVKTQYNDISFKHLLLPLWISAYIFKSKVYRFLINARTGEVQGERPYSFWKIFFTVLAGLAIIAGVIYYFKFMR